MSDPTEHPGSDVWSQLPEAIAPPQANGELLFDAPWQGRAFGMVHSLVDDGLFSWEQFREQLIIALDSGAASADVYYERLLVALEASLALHAANSGVTGVVPAPDDVEITRRTEELAARPHGHDH